MKMYKKPITEVTAFETERMMDGLATLSPAGGEGPGGSTGNDAPRRRGDIIE